MNRWLALVVVVVSGCRAKDTAPPIGSAGSSTSGRAGSWSASIIVGKSSGVLALASGPIGTFVVSTRNSGASIVANGKELVASSAEEGSAYVQLDTKGNPIWGGVINATGLVPTLSVGNGDAVASIGLVSIAGKGAIATLPSKAMTPIDGNVLALSRTASGTIWLAGRDWGSDDPLAMGKCDRSAFLARRVGTGAVEIVDCDRGGWTNMHVAALGEDVVMCASDGNKLGGTTIEGQTFLARVGADGKLAWLRYINEVGDASCDDVVVTSDGDIVAAGVANENVDLSEGARAKGVKVASSGGMGLDRLWLARYAGDGTRRWARVAAESIVGFSADIDADRSGNVLLATNIATSLDLGHGPIGPKDGSVLIATIDREANVTGLVTTKGVNTERAVFDTQDGVVMVFASSAPISVAGVSFTPPAPGVESLAIVRVPLPLPKP